MDFIQHNETITIIIRPDMFVLPEQKYENDQIMAKLQITFTV